MSEFMKTRFEELAYKIMEGIPIAYREERFDDVERELLSLIDTAVGDEEKYQAFGMLAQHYNSPLVNNFPLAEEAMRKCIEVIPERADAWLNLAEHFHYCREDLDCAARYIEVALEKGLATGERVRQILGSRIRIAIAQRNYPIVNVSLKKLVDYQPESGAFDVGLESDFIPKIPSHLVDDQILSLYMGMVGQGKN